MEKMKNRNIIGYGLGSMGKDLALGVIGSYLLIFYTDVFGISAAAAGAILFLTKVWDAINDPMMGAIADRTKRTKWGKYRPYVLLVPVPLAIFSFLCFLTPDWSTGAKVAYAAVTYTITGMLFTAYDVPLWGMVPSLSSSMHIRNKLIASARTCTTLAMLIASAAAMPAIYALGGGTATENLRSGYPKFMAVLGVFAVICAWITFASTKEVVYEKEEQKTQGSIFKQFLEAMNPHLVMVLLMMLFAAMGMLLPSVSGAFYMTYYLQLPNLIPVYMMVAMGAGLITSVAAPMLMKKFSAKSLTMAAFGAGVVVGVIVFVMGRGSFPILMVLFAVTGLCTGILMVTITTLLTEVGESIAREKGKRVDGVVFSMNSFAIKVGQAFASVVVSAILAVTGYVANSMEQTQMAYTGILLTRSLLSALVSAIGFILAFCYRSPGKGEK